MNPQDSASRKSHRLREGWCFQSFVAGSHSNPEGLRLDEGEWHAARIPCTVASALRDANSPISETGENLDDLDHWFHCAFDVDRSEESTSDRRWELAFYGLATVAEIWLNDDKLATTENMFMRSEFDVTDRLGARNDLWICFRALTPLLREKRSRARWRTRLAANRNLRFIRTTLLGRMPSWCPTVAPVGPWRDVELISKHRDEIRCERANLQASLDDDGRTGRLQVDIALATACESVSDLTAWLELDGRREDLQSTRLEDELIRLSGDLHLEDIECWWPHTHGEPHRVSVSLHVSVGDRSTRFDLDPIGFRRIELVGPPGPAFALEVNGEAIFCRGTCWTPVDPQALACTREAMRGALEQARDAGMNMLRVSGNTIYESDDFYALCDELGILVWQDFMFSTFDYPRDAEFCTAVRLEAEQFLERTAARACIAVLCGNSEGQQQPAMLGLGRGSWESPIFDDLLPALCQRWRPDVPYWTSTPSGGDLPFRPDQGTSHYFGVGAYRRSLSDAILARPQFMTECLALSNVPSNTGPDETVPSRIPQDVGADWNFKHITDHYLKQFYGEAAAKRAASDRELGAVLGRATSALLMEKAGMIWRDPESSCQGALVWLHRDPWACAGWGVIDSSGHPKSAYYGLKRAWASPALAIIDDGLNGLRLLAFNDGAQSLAGRLDLQLMRVDGTLIAQAEQSIRVEPRSTLTMSVEIFLGEFLDASYAYQFGPRAFDVCVARLDLAGSQAPSEQETIEAIHLPIELGLLPKQAVGLQAHWQEGHFSRPRLCLSTERFAQTVVLDLDNGIPSDNFFHLPPHGRKQVWVDGVTPGRPVTGTLSALNSAEITVIPGQREEVR